MWSETAVLSNKRVYGESTAFALGPGWSAAVVWKQRDPQTAFGRIMYAGIEAH
jgi:hypothetical protein